MKLEVMLVSVGGFQCTGRGSLQEEDIQWPRRASCLSDGPEDSKMSFPET